MGLFDIFSKSPGPYKETSTNLFYNMLFCDETEFYKKQMELPYPLPWEILFSNNSSIPDLKKIIDDPDSESRVKLLAYHSQREEGYNVTTKELLAVIVEVGLDEGLDVLASYRDGTAHYINHTERMIIWDTSTDVSEALTDQLFNDSLNVVRQIGKWNKPRRRHPESGMARISFPLSDGLYFGEASVNSLFNDPMASPALLSATALMQFLTGIKN